MIVDDVVLLLFDRNFWFSLRVHVCGIEFCGILFQEKFLI